MPTKAEEAKKADKAAEWTECDVAILGSGLAGSIMGAILARQGANVVLIDAGQHPRFAVGESQNPQLVEWLHILAVRYDVPEIKHMLDVKAVTEHIGPTHGRKQSFGFVTHRPNREPDPHEATMFVIPKMLTEAVHLFRQDTDSHYLNVAAKYGCTLRQNWFATDLDVDDDGVTITGRNGEVFRAKYLIDASGFRSPLVQKFDLRENPPRHKHHARSLFTHYVGIKPYDDVCNYPEALRPPAESPFHGGTLHHLIERGWFWIIPFDNYKDSKNPACSVGLTFDERLYPKPKDMTPDQEFNHYLDMYPAVKRQFEGAKRIREWVSTDRLQYSSKRTIGARWCLMSHAAGFIDPLYSRGLSNTFEVVDALAYRILDALRENDFTEERFEYVERLEQGFWSTTTRSSTARTSPSATSGCGTRCSGCGRASPRRPPCARSWRARTSSSTVTTGTSRRWRRRPTPVCGGRTATPSRSFSTPPQRPASGTRRARSTVTRPRTSSSRRSATASPSTRPSAGRAPRTSGSSGPPPPR